MSAAEETIMRKRPSRSDNHVFSGAFTRRKSKVFLHRTRSGRCRPDPTLQQVDLTGSRLQNKKPRMTASTQDQEVSAGAIFSPFLVKDLRARRVTSASVKEENDGKPTLLEEADSLIIHDCLEDVKKLVGGFPPEKQHAEVAGDSLVGSQVVDDENVDKLKSGLPSSSPQSTPPDAEICADKNTGAQIRDKLRDKPSTKEFPGGKVRRSVRNPCSRMKLFKAPNSVSYRRMLPFLMGIAREYSDASEKGQNHKSEDSLVQSSIRANLVEESERDSSLTKDHNGEVSNNSPVIDEPCSIMNADGNAMKFKNEMCCDGLVISKSSQDSSLIMADYPLKKVNSAKVRCDETELKIGSEAGKTTTLVSDMQDSKCSSQSQERHPCADGVSDQVVHMMEGCVEAKRPNADSVCESKKDASGGSPPDTHTRGANHVISNSSSGNSQDNNAGFTDDRLESCTKGKQVLKSGRRKKVFQIPGSLNYRRMLHILTAAGSSGDGQFEEVKMSKNGKPPQPLGHHTGSSKIIPVDRKIDDQGSSNMSDNDKPQPSCCHTDSSNIIPVSLETIDQGPSQMSDIDRPPSPLGLRADSSKMIPVGPEAIGKCRTQMSGTEKPPSPLGHRVDANNIFEVGLETVNQGSKCNKQLASSPDHIASFQRELDLEQESPPEPIESNCPDTIGSSNGGQGLGTSFSSPINSESVMLSESTIEDSVQTSFGAQPTKAGLCLKKTVPSDKEVPAVFLRKGILKQNPRGCRGVCTCLNCSSFRLHAERAFDFSRNQMQDAEEVALDLMKELENLRAMLQESSFGAAGQVVICLNQVKEACRKCSGSEEIAKHRLSQMNNELSIHCRVPYEHGARVRFANDVELVIPSADLQNSR